MSELTELRKEIAGLFSGLAKSKNALRKIEARVAKALDKEKEPDIWRRIKEVYGKHFGQLPRPEGFHWSMKGGVPEFRVPQSGECFLADLSHTAEERSWEMNSPRLILIPIEPKPDVYEQIREWYGRPFSELSPPDGYFFLMAGLKEQSPIFRRADPGEWWLGVDDTAFIGPTTGQFLILRPAKRIPAHNEDLRGEWVLTESGSITHYRFVDVGKTRYRREGGPK